MSAILTVAGAKVIVLGMMIFSDERRRVIL